MSAEPYWIEHDGGSALAWGAAQRLAQALRWGVQADRGASLVLGAGDLPLQAYRNLADAVVDWRRVQVVPSDDLWVPPTDPRSRQRALERVLAAGPAARAGLIPLFRGSESAGDDAHAAAHDVARLARPFDAVVLAVEPDGGIAGLRPGTDGLDRLLAPETPATVAAVDSPEAGIPHLTLTLNALADAGLILVLGQGTAERAALTRALDGDVSPLRALFDRAKVPVEIHVCP